MQVADETPEVFLTELVEVQLAVTLQAFHRFFQQFFCAACCGVRCGEAVGDGTELAEFGDDRYRYADAKVWKVVPFATKNAVTGVLSEKAVYLLSRVLDTLTIAKNDVFVASIVCLLLYLN